MSEGTSAANAASATADSANVVAKVASATPSAECANEFEYLVAPQKYEDGDLFRAIAADGDQVYFRNAKQVFRVPLKGGASTVLSKAPGLTLSGRTALFTSGERLIAQSAGESIFMAAPKGGGEWSTIIDLTAKKLGGGRDAATRILQGLGGGGGAAPRASDAAFDGSAFYWAETTSGRGAHASSTSTLRSVSLAGSDAKTLYQTTGDLGEVTKAGDRIVFMRTEPASAEQLKQRDADRKAKKIAFAPRGEQHLMSVPLTGGEAKNLARISHFIANVVLGADGSSVYVSGYADEDVAKPGIYRIDANGSNLEQLDKRVLHGRAFVVGGNVIFAGASQIEPGVGNVKRGQVVLSMPQGGKSLTRVACLNEGYTAHAYAVYGKNLLISLFKSDTQMASIAKVPLP